MPYRRRAIVLLATILIAANAAAEVPVQVETVSNRAETGDVLLKLDAELAQLALERALAEGKQREIAVADARRRFVEAEAATDIRHDRSFAYPPRSR